MKYLKYILLGLVALVVLVLLIVWLNLNHIVRTVVQTQTQASLNLETKLGGAQVSLFSGSVALDDLQIGSPTGFSAPEMFATKQIAVSATYSQLRQQPVHVKQLTIDRPNVVIEQANGKLNINALMQQGESSPPSSGEPMKVIVDDLKVNDSTVVIRPGIPGLSQTITVPIASIDLQNVGRGEGAENGVAIKQVVLQVMQALAAKAADSDKLPPEVRQLLKLNVGNLGESLQTGIKSATQDVSKNLGEQLQNALTPKKKKKQ